MGMLTQSSDDKLCKADLGLPYPIFLWDCTQEASTIRKLPLCSWAIGRPVVENTTPEQRDQSTAGFDNFCIQSSVGRPRGRSQQVLPLGTLWSSGNHTHGLKTWKIQMQRVKAKEGKGRAKKCWETSTPGRTGGKEGGEGERDPPSPFSLETAESSLSVQKSKKINASSLLWSPPALSLSPLANMSLFRTGCCTTLWYKLAEAGWTV